MTRRRIVRIALAASLVVTGLMGAASTANASFHLMKIREVFPSTGNQDSAFIELQMTAAGQNLVSGQVVNTYTAAGGLLATFTIPGNVALGDNNRTVLIGDTNVAGRDFTWAVLGDAIAPNNAAGAACFLGSNDCVSYGAFTGAALLPGTTGTPTPAIPAGSSINRSITPGCATLLEDADDTNNSATDFALGAPSPRGNAVAPTEKACTPVATKKKCKKKKRKGAGKSHEPSAAKKKKRCAKKKKK